MGNREKKGEGEKEKRKGIEGKIGRGLGKERAAGGEESREETKREYYPKKGSEQDKMANPKWGKKYERRDFLPGGEE